MIMMISRYNKEENRKVGALKGNQASGFGRRVKTSRKERLNSEDVSSTSRNKRLYSKRVLEMMLCKSAVERENGCAATREQK